MPSATQVRKAFGLTAGKIINSKLKIKEVHVEEKTVKPYHLYSYTIYLQVVPQGQGHLDQQSASKILQNFLHQSHRILAVVNTYEVIVIPQSIQVQPFEGSYIVRAYAEGRIVH